MLNMVVQYARQDRGLAYRLPDKQPFGDEDEFVVKVRRTGRGLETRLRVIPF